MNNLSFVLIWSDEINFLQVGKIKRENPEYTLPFSDSKAEDDICYISPGNLYFDVVLSKKLVTQLVITYDSTPMHSVDFIFK